MITLRPNRRAYDAKPAPSSAEVVALNDLKSKLLVLALQYWNDLRGTRPFPAREEITPRGMAPFLHNVVLVRVIDGGVDYEYRIAGEAFVNAFGMNFKGMLLSQVQISDPDYGHATHAVYECVRNIGQPFALRGTVGSPTARFSAYETIFFPLGKDGVVDHLLCASVYTSRPAGLTRMPLDSMLPLGLAALAAKNRI